MEDTTCAIAHMLDPVIQGNFHKTNHDRYEMTKKCIQVEHDLNSSAGEIDSPSFLGRAPTLVSDEIDFSYQTLATLTQNGLSSRLKCKNTSDIQAELEKCLSPPLVAKEIDVLQWWKSMVPEYPKPASVIRKIYPIPDSSASPERVFLKLAKLSLGSEPILTAKKEEKLVYIAQNLSVQK